jgi:DNA ligase-1
MAKSEYVMLAHVLDPAKHRIGGWFISEKLDGTRAIWDGGVSRGVPVEQVPYANKVKDGRYLEKQIATGLWSRSGKVINPPEWWLDKLPQIPLDGELWIGYGEFQKLRKVVSHLDSSEKEAEWNNVQYLVFDSPGQAFFEPRDIKIRNDYNFAINRGVNLPRLLSEDWSFELRHIYLKKLLPDNTLPQERLPLSNDRALEWVDRFMHEVLRGGGEGVVLRNGSSKWVPERSWNLLKHKPFYTDEGTVIGYTAGEAGKTGQLLGKIGALILRLKSGKELKLSGMTHQQREIDNEIVRNYAIGEPGSVLPSFYSHHLFPIGTVIEFKYRELSDDGIPKEARFDRIKGDN